MQKLIIFLTTAFIIILTSFNCNVKEEAFGKREELHASQDLPSVIILNAESAGLNNYSAEIVEDTRFNSAKALSLKAGIPAALNGERSDADLVFHIKVPQAGIYIMNTYALTDDEGAEQMRNATSKFESLFIRIQIDDRRATKRVVYVPWDVPNQISGKFEFNGEDQQLKIWLPRGVRLETIRLSTYVPPKVPDSFRDYRPEVIPLSGRPRLWANANSLPEIRSNLGTGENKAAWEKVRQIALDPYDIEFNEEEEMSYNDKLESAAESKAFYYLMTGDKKIGMEAVNLMTGYLSLVEFGNILDITREIGRAIYIASLVYDWCYDLLSSSDKKIMYENLIRLATDMEIRWPPFKQQIVNGHGNEAQVNRDLLSMSIALYDEDPMPYKYCSYRILTELLPLRKWEYQSPRHNQGVNYGAYRIGWDLHAAWLFYRMTGREIFDANIKNVAKYWLYMRLPDGQMFRDGDGFSAGPAGEFYYWRNPQTMFLFYTYANDPVIKAEFERQGGIPNNPVLFLLLNDPSLKADTSLTSLPLTMDFGDILGSMIARTGWNIGLSSNDVLAEIKGGGYHFGNHQHSDAGSIQIYYRGFQLGDNGLYGFYGIPYDVNFNKRSIAHSMMLVVDPDEKFGNTESNDGGTRYNQRNPQTVIQAQTDPWFDNGEVLSCNFGPSKLAPYYSYFSVSLKGAYSSKIESYNRSLCFLNLDTDSIPAAIILTDVISTSNPEFKKYWQINTHNLPEKSGRGIVLHNERNGLVGKTYLDMLIPAVKERDIRILSGADATASFEFRYEVPERFIKAGYPEANGHRVMISPKEANKQDKFLTVFQMAAGNTSPFPVKYYETENSYIISLADRIIAMNKNNELIDKSQEINIADEGKYQVLITGLKAGKWNIKSKDAKIRFNVRVIERENTIFFPAEKGKYIISPGSLLYVKKLVRDTTFTPRGII